MNKKLSFSLLAIILTASMILSACTPAATTQAPNPTQPAKPTEAAKPSVAPQATAVPVTEAPKDTWANVDPKGQTVLFWHQQTKTNNDALQKIVDEFNKTNEWGITVDAEYQGAYNDIYNKMLGVLNTPDAPNLVVAYQNQAATYQLGEGLVDMNPLVNSPKWGLPEADQKDFFPGFWAQDVFPTYGNARLGFPPNRSMEVMYYNQDWLAELKTAGKIDFDGPPTTPEQFKAASCAAKDNKFSKATVQGSMGYELSIDASRFASWTFAFGGDIFDYNNSKYTYDSEAAVKAWTFMQDLFKSGCATIVTEAYGDQTDFGTGKLLFSVGSSSGLNFYDTSVKDEKSGAKFAWSVAAIPHTTKDPVMNIYGASISMPKTTPEGELAAWLFLKYYTSAPVQAQWVQASKYFPVRATAADSLKDFFAANPAYKAGFDMLKYGHFEPPVPGYDPVRADAGKAMAAIADGADVASTLKTLNEGANKILAEQLTSPLPTPVPTAVPTVAPTPAPTATVPPAVCAKLPNPPTVKAGDLGSPDDPIVITFVPSGDTGKITKAGNAIADCLGQMTGLSFKIEVGTTFAASIEAMGANKAQVGFLNTFSVLLAEAKYQIIPALAVLRKYNTNDVDPDKALKGQMEPFYKGQFIAKKDSGIKTFADLKGKTFCFVDPNSTSGYIIPRIVLKANGIDPDKDFKATQNAGSHNNVAIAVYKGDCDAGVTFIDVLTDAAANLKGTYPDIADKVVAFADTDRIPNDGVQFVKTLDPAIQAAVVDGLVAMALDPGGNAVLRGLYTINGFQKIDATFYADFLAVLQKAGVDPASLVK